MACCCCRLGGKYADIDTWDAYVTARRADDTDNIVWLLLPIDTVYFEPDNVCHTPLSSSTMDRFDGSERCFPIKPVKTVFTVELNAVEKKRASIQHSAGDRLVDSFRVQRTNTCLLSIGGSTLHAAMGLSLHA